MTATIKDVASLAGVSTATVSRVLNKKDPGKVGKETALRVYDAVAALNFRPSAVGRSLKTARSKMIGVMIPSLSNPVFAEAFSGINEAARAAGYTLMMMVSEYDAAEELHAVEALMDYQVEGLVLTVTDPATSGALARLERAGIPFVLVYNQPTDSTRPTVTVDNVAVGQDVARELARLGHKFLGMIAGRFDGSDRSRARRKGFEDGLAASDLPAPVVREVDFIDIEVDQVLADLYRDRGSAPTALFCSNDLLAIAVIDGLARLGLAVPGDVAVVGVDGITVGRLLNPSLATVVQPSREMGRVAADMLLGHLERKEKPQTRLLAHCLRKGESAGQASTLDPPFLSDRSTHPDKESER